MFDPNAARERQLLKAIKRNACRMVKECIMQMLPPDCLSGLMINVREVACGDPNCSPVDTIIALVWQSGGMGVFALPLEVQEIDEEDLSQVLPDEQTLQAWKRGEEAPWPKHPPVRFAVNDRVECRIGTDPITGWTPGTIVSLHYREPWWPPTTVAPYEVLLDDGTFIFAPKDVDHVIRLQEQSLPRLADKPETMP